MAVWGEDVWGEGVWGTDPEVWEGLDDEPVPGGDPGTRRFLGAAWIIKRSVDPHRVVRGRVGRIGRSFVQ
jgi:hypothetical protein